MNFISKIKNEANRFTLVQHIIFAFILALITIFCMYAYLDITHAANLSQKDLPKLTKDIVVYQTILKPNSEKPVLYFKTSSGYIFKRGIHTPKFAEVKKAMSEKKQITIWYGVVTIIPSYLKSFIPMSPPIYQIAANGEIIVPFELMLEDHKDKTIVGYELLVLGIASFMLFCFSLFGIKSYIELPIDKNIIGVLLIAIIASAPIIIIFSSIVFGVSKSKIFLLFLIMGLIISLALICSGIKRSNRSCQYERFIFNHLFKQIPYYRKSGTQLIIEGGFIFFVMCIGFLLNI